MNNNTASFSALLVKYLLIQFVLCLCINAGDQVRKKIKIDLTASTYSPQFDTSEFASLKGRSIFISDISGDDKEEYFSDDKRVKYNVDDQDEFFGNWAKAAFEHAGLLIQESPSFWQRAFQPSVAVSVNRSGSLAPEGMLEIKITVSNYSEISAEVNFEGYINGRITLKETIPVSFPRPPLSADKEYLTTNTFTNLDRMATVVLQNTKLRESIENTNSR